MWAKEAKEELDCTGLEFLWPNQQECSLRGISTRVKEICNDMVWQNMVVHMSEKSLLALYQDMNFIWGKMLCIECCTRRERNELMWFQPKYGNWRNQKEKRYSKIPSMFRPRECQTYIVELSGNENEGKGSHKQKIAVCIYEEIAYVYKKILMCSNKSLIVYLGIHTKLNSSGLIR